MLSEIFSRVYDANGTYHDDVIKWKHFPRNWPFVQGIHRSPVNSAQRPETRSFDVFFHVRLSKRLRKQSWGCSFETTSRALWHHCNDITHLHRCTPLCILIHTVNPKWYIHGYDILCFTVAISSNSIGSMNLPIFIRVASLALPYRTRTHHGDVTWAPWHLNSPVTLLFIQLFGFCFCFVFLAKNKEISKVRVIGPLRGDSICGQWIPRTKGRYCRKRFRVLTWSRCASCSWCAVHNNYTELSVANFNTKCTVQLQNHLRQTWLYKNWGKHIYIHRYIYIYIPMSLIICKQNKNTSWLTSYRNWKL